MIRSPALVLLASLCALSAQAQVLFEDDFESGTLLQAESPPGKWTSVTIGPVGSGEVVLASEDAGFAGRYGFRLIDVVDSGTGVSNGRFIERPMTETMGNVYLRYRVRIHTFGGSGGPFPVQLHSSLGTGTIAEMTMSQSPAVARLQCGDNSGFRPCATPAAFAQDSWHIVQLGLEGLGTGTGRCVMRLDDQQVCELVADWSGRGVRNILAGAGAVDRSWDGVLDIDDVLLVQGEPPPTRLQISGPSIADAGQCLPYRVRTLNDFDGGVSVPLHPTTVAVPLADQVWPNPACAGDSGVPLQLDGGELEIGVVFTGPARVVSLRVEDVSLNLEPGNSAVQVLFAVPDAGAEDAGTADAGAPDAGTGPRVLSVACGCSSSAGAMSSLWLLLAILLVAMRPEDTTGVPPTPRRSGRTDPLADAMQLIRDEAGALPLPSAVTVSAPRPDVVRYERVPLPMPLEAPRSYKSLWMFAAAIGLVLFGVALGKLL